MAGGMGAIKAVRGWGQLGVGGHYPSPVLVMSLDQYVPRPENDPVSNQRKPVVNPVEIYGHYSVEMRLPQWSAGWS